MVMMMVMVVLVVGSASRDYDVGWKEEKKPVVEDTVN